MSIYFYFFQRTMAVQPFNDVRRECKYPVILELDILPRIVRESQKYEEVWVDHKEHGNDPFLVIVWYRNR